MDKIGDGMTKDTFLTLDEALKRFGMIETELKED